MNKTGRKSESFSHLLLAVLPSLLMQPISIFLKQVCFFLKKILHIVGFLQLCALNPNIRHDPSSKYNPHKVEHSKHQGSCGVWGCSKTPVGVSGGRPP